MVRRTGRRGPGAGDGRLPGRRATLGRAYTLLRSEAPRIQHLHPLRVIGRNVLINGPEHGDGPRASREDASLFVVLLRLRPVVRARLPAANEAPSRRRRASIAGPSSSPSGPIPPSRRRRSREIQAPGEDPGSTAACCARRDRRAGPSTPWPPPAAWPVAGGPRPAECGRESADPRLVVKVMRPATGGARRR